MNTVQVFTIIGIAFLLLGFGIWFLWDGGIGFLWDGGMGMLVACIGVFILVIGLCISPTDAPSADVNVSGQIEVTEQAPADTEDTTEQGTMVEIDGNTYALIDGTLYPVAS